MDEGTSDRREGDDIGGSSSSSIPPATWSLDNASSFSNLQVLTNQLNLNEEENGDESGDDNNESVEDNSSNRASSTQMNISNDECCLGEEEAEAASDQCQSVIHSNFDQDHEEVFETNMEKLSDNPNLVLTVDDDGGDEEEDVTINTAHNLTKVSDSTNQQDEDYIDEDFAPNQLNVSSGDEAEEATMSPGNDDELSRHRRLGNNADTASAAINNFADHSGPPRCSRLLNPNDLTTVNDFNAEDAVSTKVLFQDDDDGNDFEPASSYDPTAAANSLADHHDKPFVKNIDEPDGDPMKTKGPAVGCSASSSLKFESVSSIEDNSNEFLPSSKSSVTAAVAINECEPPAEAAFQSLLIDSASSTSLAEESAAAAAAAAAMTTSSELSEPGVVSENEAHIWTETEALLLQHEQTSPSACGASAIINVLKGLNYPVDLDAINSKVKINSRIPESQASTTTLAQYLFSRSVAGMNAQELIQNIETITESHITGRFFAFYPPREVNLSQWLAHWIRKGAVPVALLNLQKISIWGFIPDAWHHQMIYACDSDGVYLTNPIERVSIETLMLELTSESVLLVRAQDVIKRFKANNTNLMELLTMRSKSNKEKRRWFEMNVLGQVINVLREHKASTTSDVLSSSDGAASDTDFDSGGPDASTTLIQNSSSEDLNRIDLMHQHGTNAQFMVETNGFPVSSSSSSSAHLGSSSSSSGASSSSSMTTHVAIPASYVPGITLFAHRDSQLLNEILSASELSLKKT